MEKKILELIESEISNRFHLALMEKLEIISRLYDIPIDRLIKDTRDATGNFCKGINKSHQRCLKKPLENGYCGFHKKQAPCQPDAPLKAKTAETAPWD